MRPSIRSMAVLAVAGVALISLAGCTSSGSGSKESSAPGTVTASANAPVQHPVPTSVANVVTLRRDVKLTACGAGGGGWQASGTITNHSSAAHQYKITVFFTTPHATVQDYAVTSVPLKLHASAKWSVHKAFKAVAGTQCVLRGVG